ncbi:MAG: ATP-binding cassette domain-containing protein, partial [Acidimicrobiales bacterium]
MTNSSAYGAVADADPDASSVPVFQADAVSKRFGNVVALEGVDIEFRAGEIVGLLGDNGAGKSTFVKIAAGVHQPSRGTIRLDGEAVRFRSAYDAREAGIEAVHQDLGLVDSMSIARNFFLGAELKRGPFLDLRRMQRETRRLLTEIGLGNLRDVGQDVSHLSGGERQAISIGRAVAFQRKMLILDEPTSALSVKETDKVFEYVRMAKQKGLAVLVIMHNLVQVSAIADRFVVFWHGHKAADLSNRGQSERELSEYILLGHAAGDGSGGSDES